MVNNMCLILDYVTLSKFSIKQIFSHDRVQPSDPDPNLDFPYIRRSRPVKFPWASEFTLALILILVLVLILANIPHRHVSVGPSCCAECEACLRESGPT